MENCTKVTVRIGRPPIYDEPMTAAQRMRRYRAAKKRDPRRRRDLPTRKQQAKYAGCSLRQWHYITEYLRNRTFEWDGDVLNGKHGRIAIAFIAWVCTDGDAEVQRMVHDTIKRDGAKAGRELWFSLLDRARS